MKKIILLFVFILCLSTFVFSGDDKNDKKTDSIPPIPTVDFFVDNEIEF